MKYYSTRGQCAEVLAAEAIIKGLAPDGGLFVPDAFPALTIDQLLALKQLDYRQRAQQIMSLFLPEFSDQDLQSAVNAAYNSDTFDDPAVAPLYHLNSDISILELWHGPTSAFKDMALQMLPQLHAISTRLSGDTTETVILVATSGDTGKAALEGFKNVNNTKIIVFYPQNGVSEIQKQQMLTQEGNNVFVAGVIGNFDDAQSGVKSIFGDQSMISRLAQSGKTMSSANSINWGRLLPQIVYYISSYVDMMSQELISRREPVNFVVPTGNFGNILAGYYAYRMGLPVNKLICASNANNVLTDFLQTGVYNRNRLFHQTISPSMDILISSNLERLLYEMTNHDADQVRGWMQELNRSGQYKVDAAVQENLSQLFAADYCNDQETLETIRHAWEDHHYLLDTHTAVAYEVYRRYQQHSADTTKTIIVSTASPFKFTSSVAQAILPADLLNKSVNEFELLKTLSSFTGVRVPSPLMDLDKRPVLHSTVCEKAEMAETVLQFLKI